MRVRKRITIRNNSFLSSPPENVDGTVLNTQSGMGVLGHRKCRHRKCIYCRRYSRHHSFFVVLFDDDVVCDMTVIKVFINLPVSMWKNDEVHFIVIDYNHCFHVPFYLY